MASARESLARLDECLAKLREVADNASAAAEPALLDKFSTALDDDLNVAAAWGAIFQWVRETNRLLAEGDLSPSSAAAALAAWEQVDSVFGIGTKATADAPAEIMALLHQRESARKAMDFTRADAIRDQLKARGWVIEDTAKGPRLKKLHA